MKKRILTGFGALLIIFFLGSLVAVLFITRTTDRIDRLILLHQVEILRENLIIRLQEVQSHVIRGSVRGGRDVDVLVSDVSEMDKAMDSCVDCHHSPEVTRSLTAMRDMAGDYKKTLKRMVAASVNAGDARFLKRETEHIGRELINMTQAMAFTANIHLRRKTQETMDSIRKVRFVLYGTLLIGFFLAFTTASVIARTFNQRLQKLLDATRRISRGELNYRVEIPDGCESEFRELGESFNGMTRNLQRSQRQLVQSSKLAAIGELAANIAYEVNNPLTGVLGYSGLLLKADDIPAERKEHLKTIEREALRAREILKNLLDFARRKPARREKTDIGGMIEDTLNLVKGQIRVANVSVEVDCPGQLPRVAVDRDEIKQVFVNLINNALFAMPGGGTLSIRCRHEKDISERDVVAVSFADSGIGIPESQLDRIFDPFFTTRLDGQGTGLGLSVSYMVVQNHDGRIEVESRVGEGSLFRVVLPAL